MKRSLIVFFTIYLLSACKKEDLPTGKTDDATVMNEGDPALDGCGWSLKIQDTRYKPEGEVPVAFRQANLKVTIVYRLRESYSHCAFNLNTHRNIDLISIKKK